MPVASQSVSAKRAMVLGLALLLWAVLLVGRLVHLQIIKHEDYANYARSQQTREIKLLGPRGAIYDRKGNVLALSLEQVSIAINPMRVPDAGEAARMLSEVFGLDQQALRKKIERYQTQRWGFLWIRRWASPEEEAKARALKADWLEYYKESKRHYPNRELASHVIGSVNVDGEGLFGLELSMQYLLGGMDGSVNVLQDVRRRPIQVEQFNAPQPGISVYLTLDHRVQHAAEVALRKAVKEHKVAGGSIVVMNPHNGDILAMASYPDFDPNQHPRTTAEIEKRLNRAVSMEYEPGSVFKVITLAAGLEQTRYTPDSIINCGNGSMRIPGRVIHDHKSYQSLSYTHVLAKSSNIGSINVAFAIGKDAMHDYVRRFGFGDKTGLPLPYERSGYVWPMHKINTQRVYQGVLASVAMGHQISATTVQLAQACSVIANGGKLVRPRLINKLRSPGDAETTMESEAPVRVLQPETAITMRKMMETVMLDGTGKAGRVPGWTSGGKTGTAQIFDLEQKRYLHLYNSSFLGFAPLQNPSIAVVVTLNETKLYGGVIAAPVFKEVAEETLRILRVPMDNPQTVLAGQQPIEGDDVMEGDPGLSGQRNLLANSDLYPDTRKELVAMLSNAIKEDPEIEDWMLGDPRVGLPSAPLHSASTRAVSDTPFVRAAGSRDTAASTDRPNPEFSLREFQADAAAVQAFSEGPIPENQPIVVPFGSVVAPDFLGKSMRDVMTEAAQTGVQVRIFGRGVARQQIPPAGSRVPKDVSVRVLFAP